MENKLRRSSRRTRGLAPRNDVLPPRAMYLPPELKVAVLAQLDKMDLKTVRLVSKEWNTLATKPLFDRVYISSRAKDMEVFKNITGHPVISTGIRELAYDGSLFGRDLEFKDYFDSIFYDVFWIAQRWCRRHPDTPFDSGDVQTNKFFQYCQKEIVSYSKLSKNLYKNHKRYKFLVEGHQKHRDHSAFERSCIESGLFSNDLYTGLGSLNNLRSVVVRHDIWNALHEDEYLSTSSPNTSHRPLSGSPLCRTWNPFHLRPCGWRALPDVDYGRYQIRAQLHMLTWAIRATNKQLNSLRILNDDLKGGFPEQALNRSNWTDYDIWHFMTAYSSLRCLDIRITIDSSDHRDALTVLPELLTQTRGLEQLSIRLSKDICERYVPTGVNNYCFNEIFPAIGVWPRLTELSLSGLAIGGWDLVMLISGRARLRRLELNDIDLLDGTWEGVVEGMRCLLRLTELKMKSIFKHCGSVVFWPRRPRDEHTDWELLCEIEFYVVHGGRHPCLTPESDAETAWDWYLDMIPEKEIEDLRLSARERGLFSVDLFLKCR